MVKGKHTDVYLLLFNAPNNKMDRYDRTNIRYDRTNIANVSGRVCVVGIRVFTVKFFQLFWMFKVFHNKNIFFK